MHRRKKTFRFKLYYIFMISIIVPIIILGIFFTLFYSRTIISRENKNIEYVLKSIGNSMDVHFTELKNIGDTYYMHKEIFQEIEALNNPKLYENYDDFSKRQLETNYTTSMIKKLYMSKQELLSIGFFPMNSKEQTAYYVDKNYSGLQAVRVVGYEEKNWFKQAIEADGQDVFFANHVPEYIQGKGEAEEVFSCVRAIRNIDNKKVIGVVKIDAGVKNLQEIVDVMEDGAKDKILISAGNRILAASDNRMNLETDKLSNGIHSIDGRIYYIQSMKIADTDWRLIYLFSMQTVIWNYLLVMVAVCIVTGLAVLCAFLIYRRYSRETVDDMENITRVLREIQRGNLEIEAEVKSGNELHDIANAINQMIQNLKEYIEKEYVWVIRQQKAEYQALQAQINPHFLYNTLNGFLALNRMGETKKLEKSIINLSYLFRYICSSSGETTIEKECDFLREYLELEKLKYEDRLEYMILVDDECKNKKIPKLLLQPIVENSIVHGMGDMDDPMLITVMAKDVETKGIGKVTIITVRDNGVGFEQKALKDGQEHVGIDNVRIRAELFAKNTIYQCVSTPGKGTKTTFVFDNGKEGRQE